MIRPTITISTATLEALIAEARRSRQTGETGDSRLYRALGGLGDDQLAELVALSFIGYSVEGEQEWSARIAQAHAMDSDGKRACLLAADDLADLLEDGLIELGCALMTEQELAAA